MADGGFLDARLRRIAPLRFGPELEPQFRHALRNRMKPVRTIMFLVAAAGFGFAPLYNEIVFSPTEAALPLIVWIELAIVTPLALFAAALTYFPNPTLLRQGVQSATVVTTLAATIGLRVLSLHGGLHYPAQMTGVALLGLSYFGGFSWWRVAPMTLVVIGCATGAEFVFEAPASYPMAQAYTLLFMGFISILSGYHIEFLMRLSWLDYITLRNAESALRQSEQRFKGFMEHTPMIAWIKDADGCYVYRNKAHVDCYGGSEDWTGRRDVDLFPPEDARAYLHTDGEVLKTGKVIQFDVANRDHHGAPRDWWVHKFPIRDERGRMAVAGIGVDVHERRKLQRELQESEARFQAFLDHNPGLSWMKDEEGRYVFASASYHEAVGQNDVRGRTDFDFLPQPFARRMREVQLKALETQQTQVTEGFAPGVTREDRYWMLLMFPFIDSQGRRFTGGIATDITERKRAEELARMQSLSDELTGLYNRRGLHLLAGQELRSARRNGLGCALLCVDLDGLKQVNDQLGHAAGDNAIVAMSEVLRQATRGSDIVARVGGDEFVVFAVDADPEPVRQRVLQQVESINAHGPHPFRLSASVGFVRFEAGATAPLDDMLAMADAEMYRIKHGRKTAA